MPWIISLILLPIILGVSFQYTETSEHLLFSRLILIPFAIFLGLKYGNRGALAISVFSFMSLPVRIFGQTHLTSHFFLFEGGGDISIWLCILIGSSIGAYNSNLFTNAKFNSPPLPLWPAFILLFLPYSLGNTFSFSPILAIFYIFIKGIFDYNSAEERRRVFFIITTITLFFAISTSKVIVDIGDGLKILNAFASLQISMSLIFSYIIGQDFKKNTLKENYPKRLFYIIIIPITIISIIEVSLKSEESIFPDDFFYLGGKYISYLILFYIGFKFKSKGAFLSLATLLIMSIFFLNYGKIEYTLTFNAWVINIKSVSASTLLSMPFFLFFGVISNIKVNKIDFDLENIISISSNKIKPYFFVSFMLVPIAVIFTIFSGYDNPIEYMKESLGVQGTNEALIKAFKEAKINNLFFIGSFFVALYIFIVLVQIGLASLIVKRNGIAFDRNNFPKYTSIHDILEREFPDSTHPLYIVSTNKIGLWNNLAERFLKIYESLVPIIPSSIFNEISKDEKQLLFLSYRNHARVNLKHYNLWWFMYPLTFIPLLNFLYTYGRRALFLNINLYAYHKLKLLNQINLDSVLSAIATEETETGIENISQLSIDNNIQRHFLSVWLEYFSPRPHLQTILYTIKKYEELQPKLDISLNRLGVSLEKI